MKKILNPSTLTLCSVLLVTACESSLSLPGSALEVKEGAGLPAAIQLVSGSGQSGRSGTELAQPFVVTVTDRYGDPVSGATVDWNLESGSGQLSESSTLTATNGSAEVRLRLPTGSEAQVVSAVVRDSSPSLSTSFRSSGTPRPTEMTATLSNLNPVAGDDLTLSLRIGDQFGNARSDYVGTLTITKSDAQANLPSSYTFSSGGPGSDNGTHSFTFRLQTAGSQLITLSDPANSLTQSLVVRVIPAPASQLVLSADIPAANAAYIAGTGLPPLFFRAVDEFGNTDTSFNQPVALSLNPNDTSAPLLGANSVNAVDGVALVNSLLVTRAGEYRVRGDAVRLDGAPLAPASTPSFRIVPGPAAALTADAGAPTSATVATTLGANALSVSLRDTYQNPIPDAVVGWSTSGGTLSTPSGSTSAQGQAKNTLTLPALAGSLTVTATYAAFSTTFSITALPAAASQLSLTGASAIEAGVCQALSLSLRDPYGNFVTPAANTAVTLQDDFNNPGSQFYSDNSCTAPVSGTSLSSGLSSPKTLYFANPYNASLPLRAQASGLSEAILPTTGLVKVASITGDRGLGPWYGPYASYTHTLYVQTSSGRVAGSQTYLEFRRREWVASSLGDNRCFGGWQSCANLIENWSSDASYLSNQISQLGPQSPLGIQSIVTNAMHSCGIGANSKAYCWGNTQHGEVGTSIGTTVIVTPLEVGGALGSGVAQVAVGTDDSSYSAGSITPRGFTLARKSDGSVYCWGYNTCGSGAVSAKATPTLVSLGENAIDVSAGYQISCAVLSGGSVKCWGTGYTDVQSISGLSNVVKVSAGYQNACALLADSSVKCWGINNDRGQLATGDTVAPGALNAVSVAGVSHAIERLAMRDRSCARLIDGSVKCWGLQPGDGSASSYAAVTVLNTGVATQLAGFGTRTCSLRNDGRTQCWGNGRLIPAPEATIESNKATFTSTAKDVTPMLSGMCARFEVALSHAPQSPLPLVVRDRNNESDLYSDPACSEPAAPSISGSGALRSVVYLKPRTTPADSVLEASAEGYRPVQAPSFHFSGPAARLRVEQAGGNTENCRAISISTRDARNFVPQALSGDVTVGSFSMISSGCGATPLGYYSDSNCTVPATTVSVNAASNQGFLYVKIANEVDMVVQVSSSLGTGEAHIYSHCGCGGCGGD